MKIGTQWFGKHLDVNVWDQASRHDLNPLGVLAGFCCKPKWAACGSNEEASRGLQMNVLDVRGSWRAGVNTKAKTSEHTWIQKC